MALERVGCVDHPNILESYFCKEAVADDEIDFYEFVQGAIISRRKARAAFRDNGGFTEDQMFELRESFNKYDSDHSGEISGQELVQLFENEFPAMANDPAHRPQLIQLLHDA